MRVQAKQTFAHVDTLTLTHTYTVASVPSVPSVFKEPEGQCG